MKYLPYRTSLICILLTEKSNYLASFLFSNSLGVIFNGAEIWSYDLYISNIVISAVALYLENENSWAYISEKKEKKNTINNHIIAGCKCKYLTP